MDGNFLDEVEVEELGFRAYESVAAHIANRELAGIDVGGAEAAAGEFGTVAVGRFVEPALLVLEIVNGANLIGHRSGEAIRIEQAALIAPVGLEGMTAVEGVDTGSAPVSKDPCGGAGLEHGLAMAEGQFVGVVG